MMDNYDHDPYFIPSVPRWKENISSQDLDETIGDKFFELNFGNSLFSPNVENLSLKLIRTNNLKKENIPPRQSISQSSMRLRSSASKAENDTDSLPIAQRTRRSHSFIKPSRPSIDAYNSIEQTKPPASSVSVNVSTNKGSIFSTKPKENLNTNGQVAANSKRFRSLIKPSRPSVGSIPIASVEKIVPIEKSVPIEKNVPTEKNVPIEKNVSNEKITPIKKIVSNEKALLKEKNLSNEKNHLKVSKTLSTTQKISLASSKTVDQKASTLNSKRTNVTTCDNNTQKQVPKFMKTSTTTNKLFSSSTNASKFSSKPRDPFMQLPACTPTSKRRSSYMAPTIASAQRGQAASIKKQ